MAQRLDGRASLAYTGVKPTQPPSLTIARRSPGTNDYREFEVGSIWIVPSLSEVWMLISERSRNAVWVPFYPPATGGSVVTITGDTGGAVPPDGGGDIDLLGTTNVISVTGDDPTNTLTLDAGATIATTFTTDAGVVTPTFNNIDILGDGDTITLGAGDTIAISQTADVSLMFTTDDLLQATPALNNINIFGGTGITTSSAGSTVTITLDSATPLDFVTDSGTATEAANSISFLGGTNIATTGAGDTVTINLDSTPGVANGGTGSASYTPYTVITAGAMATDPLTNVSGVGTSAQILTSNGAGTLPTWQDNAGGSAFLSVNAQYFTSSDTYTPTANMKYCIVECIGGGGGGGASSATGAGQWACAPGGGGGCYARSLLDAATVGASQVVTIGAGGAGGINPAGTGSTGGTTSFGALVSASGGSGGVGNTASIAVRAVSGGAGGSVGTGDIVVGGGNGAPTIGGKESGAQSFSINSAGGTTFYSMGSLSSSTGFGHQDGYPGFVPGGGGGGGATGYNSAANDGGDGASGMCIVTEFISA